MSEDPTKYLDPAVLARISRLDLKARLIVEGFISGLHRSPYHGYSVEFAEHREYVPGDDIRHIDWKVFGRSDRFYIKQYEEETNLGTHILLDASKSMSYASDAAGWVPGQRGRSAGGDSTDGRARTALTKYEYGCHVAAAISYLLLRQQDAVGLALFDSDVHQFVPPRSTPSQLAVLVKALEAPGFKERTDLGKVLHECAVRLTRRGVVVLISDMLDDLEAIERGLKHLAYRDHDVLLFHVLDHDELTFPFQNMTQFEGLENLDKALVNPRAIREGYLAELEEYLHALRRACRQSRIDYVRLDTRDRLDVALSSFLAKRIGSSGR